MTWWVLGAAVVADIFIALLLRKELRRWQNGRGGLELLAVIRLVNGILLMMVFLLVAVGVAFVLPHPAPGVRPGPVIVAYWLFIPLLLGVIGLLTLLDVFLVRRGLQQREDQVLRDVLLGERQRQGEGETEGGDDAETRRENDTETRRPSDRVSW